MDIDFSTEFSQMSVGQIDDNLPIYSESHDDVTKGLRVAIIGAGASGLAILRVFLLSPVKHDIVVFERSNRVGGLWNYDGENGPMYRHLKINFAKEGMGFPDFPFAEHVPESYVKHTDVKEYLEAYADSVDGKKYIKFNTSVCSVVPLENEKYKWRITSQTKKNGQCIEESGDFDAVFVCNGHYDVPYYPKIPGLEHFPGKVMHSREYDDPKMFTGKSVVILGGGNSGQDIAADMADEAAQITISHNNPPLRSRLFPNMTQCSGIQSCDEKGFTCVDGSFMPHPDYLILATGYHLNFPFLDSKCGVINDGSGNVRPLYKHFICANNPTLYIIGICVNVAPFPMCHYQGQAALAVLEKRYTLPDKNSMMKAIEEEFAQKMRIYKREKYAHMMTDAQWKYNAELAKIAGCSPQKPYVKDVFYKSAYMRRNHLTYYRQYVFEIDGDTSRMIPVNGAPEIDEEDLKTEIPEEVRDDRKEEDITTVSSDSDFVFSRCSSIDGSLSTIQSSDDTESSENECSEMHQSSIKKRTRLPTDEHDRSSSQPLRG